MRFASLAVRLFAVLLVSVLATGMARAQLFETKAKQAILVDYETGTVLFAKNADELVPPASLAKLMTMEVVFNALKAGTLSVDDEFLVTENAWRTGGSESGGSTMFAKLKSSIRVGDLIRGVIIQSANDGCIILAEGMAGSEGIFAQLMTERARKLGLEKSVFRNSTGLPDPEQKVTMRELAKLAMHIFRTYPEFYPIYSEREFTWNKITQRNRNPLLSMDIGADGMKTGFTEESGYAIVGSASRDGRRVFIAMSGMSSMNERAEEARKLIDWGMRAFQPMTLFKAGEVVGSARLYGGEKLSVDLRPEGELKIFVPLVNRGKMKARIVYDGPVPAPVRQGQPIGMLRVYIGEEMSQETPLFAAENVDKGNLHRQALDALGELVLGWLP